MNLMLNGIDAMKGNGAAAELTIRSEHSASGQLLISVSNQIGQMMARRRVERQLLEISEREQQRIARDLHDGLSQQLAGIAYLAKDLRDDLRAKGSAETERIGRIAELLDETIQQTRRLARGLNPVRPVAEGLRLALQELADIVASLFNIQCRFQCPRAVTVADHATANHLYRIAQEAIHNAVTHGKASQILVSLVGQAGTLTLSVADNGKGMVRAPTRRDGLGLESMRHRARAAGGFLEIKPRLPRGTVVTCAVPRPLQVRHEKDHRPQITAARRF